MENQDTQMEEKKHPQYVSITNALQRARKFCGADADIANELADLIVSVRARADAMKSVDKELNAASKNAAKATRAAVRAKTAEARAVEKAARAAEQATVAQAEAKEKATRAAEQTKSSVMTQK